METVKADDAAKLGNFHGTFYMNPKSSDLYKDACKNVLFHISHLFALVNNMKHN